jgi:hypothetical protein
MRTAPATFRVLTVCTVQDEAVRLQAFAKVYDIICRLKTDLAENEPTSDKASKDTEPTPTQNDAVME